MILFIVDNPKLGAGELLKETWPRYHSQGLKLVWFGLESRHQHFGNFWSISNVFIIINNLLDLYISLVNSQDRLLEVEILGQKE